MHCKDGWRENYGQKPILFSGREWVIRDSDWKPGGPQPNEEWARAGVKVNDQGHLVLTSINRTGSYPMGAEVISVDTMGYGTYEATFSGDFASFDKYTCLGLFTYDWNKPWVPGAREIDAIEICRWGKDNLPAKFTYYPHEVEVNGLDYEWPVALKRGHIRLKWFPEYIEWTLFNADTNRIIHRHKATADVPVPYRTQFHIDLWTCKRPGWEANTPQTCVIEFFNYCPL